MIRWKKMSSPTAHHNTFFFLWQHDVPDCSQGARGAVTNFAFTCAECDVLIIWHRILECMFLSLPSFPPPLRAEWQSALSWLSSVLTTAGEHMAAGPLRSLSSPTPDLPMTLTLYLDWMSRAQTPKASVSACDRRGFEHSVNTCQGVSPPHSFCQF